MMTLTRKEAIRRIRAALEAAGHRRDRKEYVLWPPRETWPSRLSPADGPVDLACDELGLFETPRAVLQERDRREGNWIIEVYVHEAHGPVDARELINNVEIDVEAGEWTMTGLNDWRPIPPAQETA